MMRSNKFKCILLFVITFVITLFLVYIVTPSFCDEIWAYGFSYNISKGMVIYRDFNVLQTPLYFFLISIIIKLFGPYMIYMGVFDSILCSIMMVCLYKIGKLEKFFVFLILYIFYPSSYNLFITFLCFIIIYLIYCNKDNDIIIAFIVSLMFLTKQNIGIIMFIPCLIYSKNKIKSLCTFLVPILILCLYLVCNNALFDFIDYCFLGLFSFNSNNGAIDGVILFLVVIMAIYLIYKLIKRKFKDKILFYILCFLIISYPIFDFRHFTCCLFIFLCFFDIRLKFYLLYLIKIFKISFLLYYMIIIFDKYNLSGISLDKSKFTFLKNMLNTNNNINIVYNYLEERNFNYDTDYVFLGDFYGYYYKLYYDIPIGKYDFIMTGNMGYFNRDKIYSGLDNLCGENTCYFIIPQICFLDVSQWYGFAYYIDNNYNYIDKIDDVRIYSSKS